MFVFREGRRAIPARRMLEALIAGLRAIPSPDDRDGLLDALLRAGELECSLADDGGRGTAGIMAITDALAAALISGRPLPLPEMLNTLSQVHPPQMISVSPPEGFAYYALHPLNFADLAAAIPVHGPAAAIIGIRSIGTTLGAIVKAALEQRGVPAERITVRPQGHPFDRVTRFSGEEMRWLAHQRAQASSFLVVDEGPGLSGSSFLSVGDALVESRVPQAHITFLCSRQANPEGLLARDAAMRWLGFRSCCVAPNDQLPPDAELYIGGGIWRAHFVGPESEWPATWTQTERLKFFSRDRRRLYKFEGLGRFGADAQERASVLANGGFGVRPQESGNGFVAYPVTAGGPLKLADLSAQLLDRMAHYCAFRAAEFGISGPPTLLHAMVQFNSAQEFAIDPPEIDAAVFAAARPIITDSHMQPHEWLGTREGKLLKLDAVSHGEDHFYPGPTDIAWDLAGAMVEWHMDAGAREYFLERYRQFSGDDARPRLRAYLLAYTMFRLGFCKMAAEAMRGSDEEPRLALAHRRYRALAEAQLGIHRQAEASNAAD